MLGDVFENFRTHRKSRRIVKPEPFWLYQLKKLVPTLLAVYLLTFSVLYIVVTIHQETKTDIFILTQGPIAAMGAPIYAGLLFNVGVLFWSFSAAICFFCSAVLRKDINNRELPSFLLFSGIITSVFMLDDLFHFRESFYPVYLNVPENAVYAAYGIMLLLYFIRFRTTIIDTDFLLLFFALGFLGLSMVFAKWPVELQASQYLFKDGAKLFGIMTWFAYFTRIGLKRVKYAILFRQQGLASD